MIKSPKNNTTKIFVFLILFLNWQTIVFAAQDKPNIVFILVDDMGYSDLGSYGGEIDTPHLDMLANNGVRFNQMHNTAKCFTTRAALLTGIYPQQNGMHKHFKKFNNAVTLGEVLKSAGYRTFLSGKHHSQESLFNRGFDHVYGLLDGATNHFNPGEKRPGEPAPALKVEKGRLWNIDEKIIRKYSPPEKDYYSTDTYTKYALSYLDKHYGAKDSNQNKPFFLYLAYTAPHDPLQAWPHDIQKYADKYKIGYEKIRQTRYYKMRKLGLIAENEALPEAAHKPWDSLTSRQKQIEARKMAVYAAMIDNIDQNIGKLINKLKSLGKYENTLIMFASDNGSASEDAQKQGNKNTPLVEDGNDINLIGTVGYWASLKTDWANVSNTPLRFYKSYSFSGGTNTPFIAHWPKGITTKKGSINRNYLGHLVDVMPTIVDITGATYPVKFNQEDIFPMVGESFLPQLMGEDSHRKTPLYWQFGRGKAIQVNNWKAIADWDKWHLFDMSKDRFETNNLADKHPEKLTSLISQYQTWFEDTPAGIKK